MKLRCNYDSGLIRKGEYDMLELDATCGLRAMWKGKDVSNLVFLDLKSEVKPTIVGDAKNLPFRESVFFKIHCDPPHLIRNDLKHWSKIWLRYGNFKNRNEWLRFLISINREFKRVLVSAGRLWFKVTNGKDRRVTNLVDLKYLDNFREVSKKEFKAKAPWSTNKTYEIEYVLNSELTA